RARSPVIPTGPATPETYAPSLHDALPISDVAARPAGARDAGTALPDIDGSRLLASLEALGRIGALDGGGVCRLALTDEDKAGREDRKSTRLNSSHVKISYAVFCLKKKRRK